MLYWAALFFILASVAGVFGFFVLAASAAEITKLLFFGLLVVSLVALFSGKRIRT